MPRKTSPWTDPLQYCQLIDLLEETGSWWKEVVMYPWPARYRNGYTVVSHSIREPGWLKGKRFKKIG